MTPDEIRKLFSHASASTYAANAGKSKEVMKNEALEGNVGERAGGSTATSQRHDELGNPVNGGVAPSSKNTQQISERKMHELFSNWLHLHQIPFVHSRMDKKATVRALDYVVLWQGRAVCVEFKTGYNDVSDDQQRMLDEMARANVPAKVFWTVEEAIEFVKEKLHVV